VRTYTYLREFQFLAAAAEHYVFGGKNSAFTNIKSFLSVRLLLCFRPSER